MSGKKHWSDFPKQPLYPHEEKNFMTATKLIAKWKLTRSGFIELLQDENFLAHVSPFYEDQEDARERDILLLMFDSEELEKYDRLFRSEWVYCEPPLQPASKGTDKPEKKQDIQRRYWKTRAVASFLWYEKVTRHLSIKEMCVNNSVLQYGCENSRVEPDTIKIWIRDLCPNL